MPALPSVPASSRRDLWPLAFPAVVAFVYVCGHLAWYRQTPLGQVPVLDEQENLAFAEAIVRGALPAEPFYRAPGYALLLATLRGLGLPASGLFQAALTLGALLHAINATLVAGVARRLFGGRIVAMTAGLLYALNPVFVHYSTQALDAVPALTFFLLGLAWIAPALANSDPTKTHSTGLWHWVGASLSWAIATMCRPNYLALWCVLPVLAAWTMRERLFRGVFAALAGTMIFALVAGWQWRVSGVAGFLPWQGPYNLWAANQPGAHGRYYVQRHSLPAAIAARNPARAESVYLYQEEKGTPPPDIHALNTYWRRRFLVEVMEHPLAWLGRLGRKTYALLNNWEQYNNKTFAFHQARSPWLRWNPLGWGAIFVLATAGSARLAVQSPQGMLRLALIVGACAASIVLFFVSARFRLPLAALATVVAGGALAAPGCWQSWPKSRQVTLAVMMLMAAAVAFSNFDHVRDSATFVQDHALLARAADTVGDDALAWREATAALELQPAHRDALRLAVASYFNRLLTNLTPLEDETKWREVCARFLNLPDGDAHDLQAVAALALWRAGNAEAALAAWRRLGTTPSALASRLLVQDILPAQIDVSKWPRSAWNEPLVRLAAQQFNLTPPAGVTLENAAPVGAVVQRLFSHPAPDPH